MDDIQIKNLVAAAINARENAYAPYSKFKVGAALFCKSGRVFTGVNIENAAFPSGICAERAALCAAITAGEREFEALAVAAGDVYVTPCGSCRQALCEFGDMLIICSDSRGEKIFSARLSELLPHAFDRFKN